MTEIAMLLGLAGGVLIAHAIVRREFIRKVARPDVEAARKFARILRGEARAGS